MLEGVTLPISTADHARVGRSIYNELGACLSSHRDWFAEGMPGEWIQALDHLQAALNLAKRRAHKAAGTPDDAQGVLL